MSKPSYRSAVENLRKNVQDAEAQKRQQSSSKPTSKNSDDASASVDVQSYNISPVNAPLSTAALH